MPPPIAWTAERGLPSAGARFPHVLFESVMSRTQSASLGIERSNASIIGA